MKYKVKGLSEAKERMLGEGEILPVMEMFSTLQGEGYHSGLASFFIRIGGCDIGCHWCDVKESWDAEIHPLVPVNEILNQVQTSGLKHVVITGGEPLQWNLGVLTKELKKNNFHIHLETSGSFPLQGYVDWFCLSPKKNKKPLEENFGLADELKMIIYNRHDIHWSEECSKKVKSDCKLYLQPEWSRKEKMLSEILAYIKNNPEWKLSLQTHKYIGIP